ncbi:MAG: response regulator [Ignavibacteriae bacterium]|nr:response regulator [Ignavibacteriota bacterium]
MNVLLVDDNIDYLNFMKESLFLNGYTVHTATDGSEACTLLGKPDIDLIISDIKMPTLDGIMLHSFARELDRYKKTKFIFVSGYGDAYADILNLDTEIDFFFSKTTPVGELLKFIDGLMFGDFAGKWV